MHLVQRQLQAVEQLRDHFRGENDVVRSAGKCAAMDVGMCDRGRAVCAVSFAFIQVICFECL